MLTTSQFCPSCHTGPWKAPNSESFGLVAPVCVVGTSQSLLLSAGISSHPEEVGECWLQMWGRRREQRLCSPRLGGERSSGILEANGIHHCGGSTCPGSHGCSPGSFPGLHSPVPPHRSCFTWRRRATARGKGNIPLSFPGCCLLESFPLPLPLEQMLWDGISSCFTPGRVLTFAKAEGSSGREFLSQWVEDWRIGRC